MSLQLKLVGLCGPALALGVGAVLGSASAHADTLSFPCGLACADSTVNIAIGDNANTRTKVSTSKDGTVTTRVTGKGPDLDFFNPNDPSITYSLKGNGATSRTDVRPDGTSTITVTGHNILVYYPTDTLVDGQPGPATQLVTGRAVINVDTAGNWTTASQSGRVTDICAQLPPD